MLYDDEPKLPSSVSVFQDEEPRPPDSNPGFPLPPIPASLLKIASTRAWPLVSRLFLWSVCYAWFLGRNQDTKGYGVPTANIGSLGSAASKIARHPCPIIMAGRNSQLGKAAVSCYYGNLRQTIDEVSADCRLVGVLR